MGGDSDDGLECQVTSESKGTRVTPSRSPEPPRRLAAAGQAMPSLCRSCIAAVIRRPKYNSRRTGAFSRPLNIQGDRCSDAQQC